MSETRGVILSFERGEWVVLEYHNASHTSASTTFHLRTAGGLEPISPHDGIHIGGGTHAKIAFRFPEGTELTMIRVSNRGNITSRDFIIVRPMFISFLGDTRVLTKKEIETMEVIAKERGKL